MIVAADIAGLGHNTTYSSSKETKALQIPFKDGKAPQHEVRSPGPCRGGSKSNMLHRIALQSPLYRKNS